jgi:CRISPR/Cas system-associated protein endoribonuclease Cas2
MNPPRLLFLSVALCVIPFSALAEDSRPKNLIRMDLYQEGYRADQASDYVKALEKLSAFKKVNNARLAAATTSGEIAFRDSLEVKLKQLTRKIEQNAGAGKSTPSVAGTSSRQPIPLSGTQTASNSQTNKGTGYQFYKHTNKTPSRLNQSKQSVNHKTNQ